MLTRSLSFANVCNTNNHRRNTCQWHRQKVGAWRRRVYSEVTIERVFDRPVISNTRDLHHKVEEMGGRIKALEEAIEKFQASVSTKTHSLLRPELLRIKFPTELSLLAEKPNKPTLELANTLGTLTINENGSTKYFGSTAGAEVCVVRHLLLMSLTVTYLRRCSWYAHCFPCDLQR